MDVVLRINSVSIIMEIILYHCFNILIHLFNLICNLLSGLNSINL
jgi:hypothetical protein